MHFELLDVFGDKPFTGNPLYVIDCGRGPFPSPNVTQAIAAEFNLSETIFLRRNEGAYEARIHTPRREVSFAGHPLVGAAAYLMKTASPNEALKISTSMGLFHIGADHIGDHKRYRVSAEINIAESESVISESSIRRACGLGDAAKSDSAVIADCGIVFALLAVEVDALKSASPNAQALLDLGEVNGRPLCVYLYAQTAATSTRRSIEARMFAPGLGVLEDAVTGSAALSLATFFARRHAAARLTIQQGIPGYRSGCMDVEAKALANESDRFAFTLSGRSIPIASGSFSEIFFNEAPC